MQDADLERMGALNFVLTTLNHQVAPLDSAARGGQARSKQGRRRRAGSYAGASYDGEARVLTLVCDDVPPPPPASSSLFFEDPVQVCVHLPSSERDPPFLYCGEGAEGSSDAVVELALEVGREVATETAAKGPVTLMDLVGRVEARTQAAAGRVWPADDPSTSLLRRRRMEERVRQRVHGEPAGAEMAVLLLTAAANSGRRNQICRPLPPSFLHDGAAVQYNAPGSGTSTSDAEPDFFALTTALDSLPPVRSLLLAPGQSGDGSGGGGGESGGGECGGGEFGGEGPVQGGLESFLARTGPRMLRLVHWATGADAPSGRPVLRSVPVHEIMGGGTGGKGGGGEGGGGKGGGETKGNAGGKGVGRSGGGDAWKTPTPDCAFAIESGPGRPKFDMLAARHGCIRAYHGSHLGACNAELEVWGVGELGSQWSC